MGEVVNLREYRKQRKRAMKRDQAAENRAQSGRTKQERDSEAREKERADQSHSGHQIERDIKRDEDETA